MATEKKVKIKIPLTKTEKKDVYVGLNGKSYLIKRGVEVEVPEGVAEILQRREEILMGLFEREEEAKKNLDQ
jgi:hypothetical protein